MNIRELNKKEITFVGGGINYDMVGNIFLLASITAVIFAWIKIDSYINKITEENRNLKYKQEHCLRPRW